MTAFVPGGRLPPAPPLPTIVGDLHARSPLEVAVGLMLSPSALRGKLKAFPCTGPEGSPGSRWKRRASDDIAVLRAWSVQFAGVPIGIRAGVASSLAVIEAADIWSLSDLERQLGRLPSPTVQSVTVEGVRRLWFRLPPECTGCPTRNDIGEGVRLIGDGGFVVLPPAGSWLASIDDPAVDFRLLPPTWLCRAANTPIDPTPTVRVFCAN